MSRKKRLEDALTAVLMPQHLAVEDESSNHNVPKGAESHFKVTVVSKVFEGRNLLERQRMVHGALKGEFEGGALHALSMHTLTPEEWIGRLGQVSASPKCQGGEGGKKD